jgi:hypothetical protein
MKGSERLVSGTRSNSVYELRVYVGRDPLTGKIRHISRHHRGGPSSADAALRKLVEDLESKRSGGSNVKFGQLLDRWLEQIEGDRSPTTMREYRRLIEKTIRPALGSTSVRRLNAHKLDELYVALSYRGLSPASVHAVIRSACRQGVKWGWMSSNPATDASPPRVRYQPQAAPTPDEVRAMIKAAEADDPDMATLIAVAAVTGARRGELCGLKWGDVDWIAASLTIERSVAVVGRKEIIIKGQRPTPFAASRSMTSASKSCGVTVSRPRAGPQTSGGSFRSPTGSSPTTEPIRSIPTP